MANVAMVTMASLQTQQQQASLAYPQVSTAHHKKTFKISKL